MQMQTLSHLHSHACKTRSRACQKPSDTKTWTHADTYPHVMSSCPNEVSVLIPSTAGPTPTPELHANGTTDEALLPVFGVSRCASAPVRVDLDVRAVWV